MVPVGPYAPPVSLADLTMLGSTVLIPFLIGEPAFHSCLHRLSRFLVLLMRLYLLLEKICQQFAVPAMGGNTTDLAHVISTIFFISGIITLLQTTVGDRLPIIQAIPHLAQADADVSTAHASAYGSQGSG